MDQFGTSGNDTFSLQANMQQLTITLVNPYSGRTLELDEEKNVNFAKYYGEAGFDRINLTSVGDAIFLEDLNTGEQTIFDVEFIQGRAGGDVVVIASENIDYAQGIILNGGDEDDILWGNIGPDSINGVRGNDDIDGGPGDDLLEGFHDDDLIYGGDGNDTINGDASIPNASITGNDTIFAGNGDDIVTGGYGDDIIHGDNGQDDIKGEFGADTIFGGAGNDLISGGEGDDILFGGTGGDDSAFTLILQEAYEFDETLLFPDLIERRDIDDLAPPGTANLGVVDGNLSVDTQTTAKITFLESGAGYHNTLGVYNIAADGTIQMAQIAFDNVHRSVAQPGLEYEVTLPGSPDTDFGFFIISDGFRRHNCYSGFDLDTPGNLNFIYKYGTVDERPAKVTDNASDIALIYDDGSTVAELSGRGIYHTHTRGGDGINLNPDGAEHVVSGIVEEGDNSVLRLGFEDLRNLGDADFNDVVFDLEIEGSITVETVVDDNDVIDGGAGNDLIWGGHGDDTLTGGTGSDTFLFREIDYSVDSITDFEVGVGGDNINLTDLLTGYDPIDDMIADFIDIRTESGNTILSVDVDGLGSDSEFIDIAIIDSGVGGASLQNLLDDGNIVIDQPIII